MTVPSSRACKALVALGSAGAVLAIWFLLARRSCAGLDECTERFVNLCGLTYDTAVDRACRRDPEVVLFETCGGLNMIYLPSPRANRWQYDPTSGALLGMESSAHGRRVDCYGTVRPVDTAECNRRVCPVGWIPDGVTEHRP
jgi:hypothetical protein